MANPIIIQCIGRGKYEIQASSTKCQIMIGAAIKLEFGQLTFNLKDCPASHNENVNIRIGDYPSIFLEIKYRRK